MPAKVIDASALSAVLFNEPDAARVVSRIGSDTLVAPQLITFEIASVCLKKLRQHPQQREMCLAAFSLMNTLEIEIASVDLSDVIALAESSRLTVYDACYLWLARLLKCELLTLDKQLAAAIGRR